MGPASLPSPWRVSWTRLPGVAPRLSPLASPRRSAAGGREGEFANESTRHPRVAMARAINGTLIAPAI
eukprot:1154400-Alexandrium_andersonii.AAC.1